MEGGGGGINARNPPKAKWEIVCLPKSEGGLGVLRLSTQNEALLLKYLDKFFNRTDIPWVQLVWEKYYSNGKLPVILGKVHSGGVTFSNSWIVTKAWPQLLWVMAGHVTCGLIFGMAEFHCILSRNCIPLERLRQYVFRRLRKFKVLHKLFIYLFLGKLMISFLPDSLLLSLW